MIEKNYKIRTYSMPDGSLVANVIDLLNIINTLESLDELRLVLESFNQGKPNVVITRY